MNTGSDYLSTLPQGSRIPVGISFAVCMELVSPDCTLLLPSCIDGRCHVCCDLATFTNVRFISLMSLGKFSPLTYAKHGITGLLPSKEGRGEGLDSSATYLCAKHTYSEWWLYLHRALIYPYALNSGILSYSTVYAILRTNPRPSNNVHG